MSPKEQQILFYLASKYLNTQEFVYGFRPNTIKSYATDLHQFLQQVNQSTVEEINTSQIPRIGGQIYRHPLTKKKLQEKSKLNTAALLIEVNQMLSFWSSLSPATKNRKFACLRAFLKWLFHEKYIDRNLALRIPSPKVPWRVPHHLSVDEVLSILTLLKENKEKGEKSSCRDMVLFALLYGCGLRVGEACTAKWSDIDHERRCLHIIGKGGKMRMVVLIPMALESINNMNQLKEKDNIYIFGKKSLSPRTAHSVVKRWGQKSGLIKPISPHTLRHSFATHLLQEGADLRVIQEVLGHETLNTTQRYTHLDLQSLYTALSQFHPLHTAL